MHIRPDDLSAPSVRALLEEHLANMRQLSPPQSVHSLPIESLRQPDVTFWTAWSGGELLGCGALKELDGAHGEAARFAMCLLVRFAEAVGGAFWRGRTDSR